jgi:hypothetical protein
MDDRSIVAAQIGRPPRSVVVVVTRCHLGLPVVIGVPPLLDDGTPFPTTYWLTCPLATKRIGRIEAGGGVRTAEVMLAEDPSLRAAHDAAMDRYREERDLLIPTGHEGPRPSGGVGGTRTGVKCLHAHYAYTAAGFDNPIGAWTAEQVEPLDCATECVVPDGGSWVRNLGWVEPQ